MMKLRPNFCWNFLFQFNCVTGVVVNLSPSSPWLTGVLGVLQEALSADVKTVLSQLSSQLPLDNNQPTADCVDQLDSADALVQSQTMALEIITNLTASQGDAYLFFYVLCSYLLFCSTTFS